MLLRRSWQNIQPPSVNGLTPSPWDVAEGNTEPDLIQAPDVLRLLSPLAFYVSEIRKTRTTLRKDFYTSWLKKEAFPDAITEQSKSNMALLQAEMTFWNVLSQMRFCGSASAAYKEQFTGEDALFNIQL